MNILHVCVTSKWVMTPTY
ncbi:tryptophanase leader peptide [Shigella flexneri]|nr:hypothetical protein [Shigella flexneri 2a]